MMDIKFDYKLKSIRININILLYGKTRLYYTYRQFYKIKLIVKLNSTLEN